MYLLYNLGFALATRRAGGKVTKKMESFVKDLWIRGQDTKQKYNPESAFKTMKTAVNKKTTQPYFEPQEWVREDTIAYLFGTKCFLYMQLMMITFLK